MCRILIELPLPFLNRTVPIFSYGFMMMIAFAAGILLACRRAERVGIAREAIMDIGLYSIVCGIVGARLAFLFTDYQMNWASEHPVLDMFAIWKGGLTFQGGLFLALAVNIWYLTSRRLPAGKVADVFAPGVALGVGVGRLGCFLNGCCWGQIAPRGFPLGVIFPHDCGVYEHHRQMLYVDELLPALEKANHNHLAELLRHYAPLGLERIPVHPTQLYTALAMVGVFVFLLWVEKWPRLFDGMVMVIFLMAYSVVRFLIEFVRDDTPVLSWIGGFPGLRLGQLLAMLTLAVAVCFFAHLSRKAKAKAGREGSEQSPS